MNNEPEFPRELIERCMTSACLWGSFEKHAVCAVLRESGYAELVAALKKARKWMRRRTIGLEQDDVVFDKIDAALRKAEGL